MKKVDKTIKMKPRSVRGRVVRGVGRGVAGATNFTTDKARVMKRQATVRPEESKPEGDAVSNVQEQTEQFIQSAPRTVYRLTRAQVRMIRRLVEKRREAAKLAEQIVPQAQQTVDAGGDARASPRTQAEGQPASHSQAQSKIPAEPSTPDAASPFDDPAKRPLSAREIAKGRESKRAARQATADSSTKAVQNPNKAVFQGKQGVAARASQQRPVPISGKAGSTIEATPAQSDPIQPRVRKTPSHILHERPTAQAPKHRELLRQPAKTTHQVIERQTRQLVKTADAATRTAAKQSAATAAKVNAKATERAAQTATKRATQAAKHMASLARKASQRAIAQMRRAAQAAIRASIAATKALVSFLLAGGWAIVLIILVLLMCVSILASPFGIFTHTDTAEFPDSITLSKAITTINEEYVDEIKRLAGNRNDVHVVIEGNQDGGMEPANWVDVLAVFSVHVTMREENAMDVVQLDKTKVNELRKVFWDMNKLTTSTDTDEDGETTFYIEGSCLSYKDMFEPYAFTEQQIQLIKELMSDEYYAFWSNFVNISTGYDPDDWGGVVDVDDDYTPDMSGSVMKIPKLYQFDYKKTVCIIDGDRKSVSTSGCGATSMSMVIRYLTGNKEQTPYTLFKWAYKNGHYSGDGLGHGAVSAMGKLYGVTGSWVGKDGEKIVKALSSGHPVIAHMGKGIFTKQGHYIVLRGVTKDGKILVNDPNSKDRSGKAYPLSTILKQGKTSTPFMICSKKSD